MSTGPKWWSLTLLILTPALAVGQPPPPAGGPPRPMMGFGFDPNRIFDSMDRNGDGVVTRDEITDRRTLDRFEDYCRRAGVTDGRLTREAFLKGFQDRMQSRVRSGFTDPEPFFRRLDRAGTGKLSREQLPNSASFPIDFDRWDANKDGFLDLAEFKAMFEEAARQRFGGAAAPAGPGSPGATAPPPASPAKPDAPKADAKPEPPRPAESPLTLYRAGKPVPGLPPWFKELDVDADGQIALHEWKGRPPEEFQAIDRNGDGFLTLEEVLRHVNAKPKPVPPDPPVTIRGTGTAP
jgi:Ca2+-binding EF-hand superfamily protein